MHPPLKDNEPEEIQESSVSDLLYKFLPYWPFFLLLIALSLAGAWLYLRYTIPVYQATATLLIKDDQSLSGGNNPLEAFDLFGSKKSVENEMEVLKSKTLMNEVVTNLHLYAPIFAEGHILNQSAYAISPIVIEIKDIDSLKPIGKVYFNFNASTKSIKIGNNEYPFNKWVNTPFGTLQFLSGKNFNSDTTQYKFYFSLYDIKSATNAFSDRLSVEPSSKQSTVISITIQDEVPKRAEDILNELLLVYNHAAILDKNALASNTLKFVEDRLKFVEKDLDSVEGSLQSFKARNKITDISSQGQIFLQSVATNDQKISEFNIQLAVLDQVESYVRGKGGLGGIVPSTLGVTDPVLSGLLQKLSEQELKYAQAEKLIPENNPALVSLRDGIQKIKPGILENILSQKRNLQAGRNNLIETNNSYSALLKTIPEKERELLNISRQQSIKSNIYNFLLQKREETALSFSSAISDSRIIDKAESSGPVSPKGNLIYLAALFFAIALSFLILYIKELLTRTVQQQSDIDNNTTVPFLGEIMYDKSKSSIVITEGKQSFIAEQFRQLRTALGFMGVRENNKRILVTSNISGEGKSFISVNLGISLALMDKKVVLIELDLRKPKLSELFKIPRTEGISNYLIGAKKENEIIKEFGIKNLSFISSGPIPPNPSELISNKLLVQLLEHLELTYDYIIIDAAPINPVTDSFILSPICDVTLFVIRYGYTPKVFIKNLETQSNKGRLKNPAVVYNGVKRKRFSKYGYNYGYGYTEVENKNLWRKLFRLD